MWGASANSIVQQFIAESGNEILGGGSIQTYRALAEDTGVSNLPLGTEYEIYDGSFLNKVADLLPNISNFRELYSVKLGGVLHDNPIQPNKEDTPVLFFESGFGSNITEPDIAIYLPIRTAAGFVAKKITDIYHDSATTGNLILGNENTLDDGMDLILPQNANAPATLSGGSDNAVILGSHAGDVISAGNGDDIILGNEGNDIISPGEGNDTIDGGDGTDHLDYSGLDAFLDNDVVVNLQSHIATISYTLAANDTQSVYNVENIITGGGDDTLIGDDKKNVLNGSAGSDSLNGWLGDDILLGGEGADSLNGSAGSDLLSGGAGADRFIGMPGGDDVVTDFSRAEGDVVDLNLLTTVNITLRALASDVFMDFNGSSIQLNNTTLNDLVLSGAGKNLITAANQRFFLIGNTADEAITGTAVNDTIQGGGGKDSLTGGAGNDLFIVTKDAGHTTTITDFSGDQIDLRDFGFTTMVGRITQVAGGTNVNLDNGQALFLQGVSGITADKFLVSGTPIVPNYVDGTYGNDVLIGTLGNDKITGLEGNDLIQTGSGNDTVYAGMGDDTISMDTAWLDTDIIRGGSGDDSLVLEGGGTLTLNNANTLSGIDRIVLGGFAHYTINPTVNMDISDNSLLIIDARNAGSAVVNGANFTGKLNYLGSSGSDSLTGGAEADVFYGNGGADTLNGGNAEDSFYFTSAQLASGNVHIDGGAGGDEVLVSSAGDVTLTASAFAHISNVSAIRFESDVAHTITLDATATLSQANFSAVTHDIVFDYSASASMKSIAAGSGSNYFKGGVQTGTTDIVFYEGSLDSGDTIIGGAGTERVAVYDNTADISTLHFQNVEVLSFLGTSAQQVTVTDALVNQTGKGFINLVFNGFSHVTNVMDAGTVTTGSVIAIGGEISNELLIGGAGNDSFVGHSGNDTIRGGGGNDMVRLDDKLINYTLAVNPDNSIVIRHSSGETDEVKDIERLEFATSTGGGAFTSYTLSDLGLHLSYAPVAVGDLDDATVDEDTTATLLTTAQIAAAFADADGDTLAYSITLADGGEAPSWLALDEDGNLVATNPGNSDVGEYDVILKASDGQHAPATQAFTLTVNNTNDDPTAIGSIANVNVNEAATTTILTAAQIAAAFNDVDAGDVLSFSLGGSTLGWLSFNTNGDLVATNPTHSDIGNHIVGVLASDGHGGVAVLQSFNLSVIAALDEDPAPPTSGAGYYIADNGNNSATSSNTNPFADLMDMKDGDDTAYSGGGNDTIYGGAGNDDLDGGNDNDLLYASTGNDTVYGGAGNDSIFGADGNDKLGGKTGNDLIYGGNGNDFIFGDEGSDTVYGGAGNDSINDSMGDVADDMLYGGDGDDQISGVKGNDTLYGGNGDDYLSALTQAGETAHIFGESGNDRLFGKYGDDHLDGGEGNDTLFGMFNNDTLAGGGGADIFAFGFGINNGNDVILDFVAGTDKIQIINGVLTTAGDALAAVSYIGGNAIINLGNGSSVSLLGISSGSLTINDFMVS